MYSHSPLVYQTVNDNGTALYNAVKNVHIMDVSTAIKQKAVILEKKKFRKFLLSLDPNDDLAIFCLGILRAQMNETKGMTYLFSQIQNKEEWPVDLMLAYFYEKNQDRENAIFHVKLAARYHTDIHQAWTLDYIDLIYKLLPADEKNLDPEQQKISRELLLIIFNLFKSNSWNQENLFSGDMTNLGFEIEKVSSYNEEIAEKIRAFLRMLPAQQDSNILYPFTTYENLLLDATKANNIAWVKMLVPFMQSCQENLDVTTSSGDTALKIAIKNGFDEIARYLIFAGANVNDGVPIRDAITKNNSAIVKLLIERGAHCNISGLNVDASAVAESARLADLYYYSQMLSEAANCLKNGSTTPENLLRQSTQRFMIICMQILEYPNLRFVDRQNVLIAIFNILRANNLNDANFFNAEQWDILATEALGADYLWDAPIQASYFALQAVEIAEKILPLQEIAENLAEACTTKPESEEKTEESSEEEEEVEESIIKKDYQEIKRNIETTFRLASQFKFFRLSNPDNFSETYDQLLPCMEKQSAELIQEYLGKTELDTPTIVSMTFKPGSR